MPPITMNRAFIDRWTRMPHSIGRSSASASSHHSLSSAAFIINTAESDFRYTHVKVELVFTDPPYNVAIDGNVCGLGRVRHREFAMGSGEMTEAEFTTFLAAVFGLLAENTVDGSIHQICMDWRHMQEMLEAGGQAYSE